MKKKFVAKSKKTHKKKYKIIFFFLVLFSSFLVTIKSLSKLALPFQNENLIRFLLENNNPFVTKTKSNYSYFHQLMTKLITLDLSEPLSIINSNYKGLTKNITYLSKEEKTTRVSKEETPSIYIYNTHDTEEYTPTSFAEYSVMPTVKLADYVLKEELEKKGYNVLIEETTISSVRSTMGLNYAGSYQASRVLLEAAKKTNPSLEYFIDLHRDSISKDKTTLVYNDKTYAKILFLIGLENPNYNANLEFTTLISNKLNEKIPGLSKGIYKKQGAGVNGIYNQDFSPRTILIELGGPENTIDEVYETLLILSEVLSEVISSDQN